MRDLKEAIRDCGEAIGRDIIKVDSFLNHRIDTGLLFSMGESIADAFREDHPDLVLTVEASGIALALTAAHALGDIPVVFAKKAATVVQSSDALQARVYSFTHKKENVIRVDRKFLPAGARVLIVDDFLADGQACEGMLSLCAQAGCPVAGIGIGIEKGFMPGGKKLRERGIKLSSLAIVTSIEDGKVHLEGD